MYISNSIQILITVTYIKAFVQKYACVYTYTAVAY